ncbi:hypothetical protein EG68_11370, partial [Paragonimus skrjabini miyazakii]
IYELLSKVPEHFNEDALQGLPTYFYHLSATDRATQVGCDYAYTNKTVVPAIYILCFYNYPLDEWFAQLAQGKGKCLYRDHSLSFSKCNVDSPCNKSFSLIHVSFNKHYFIFLILLTINFEQ